MHLESMRLMATFRDRYLSGLAGCTVLDVGARCVSPGQRTYRELFADYRYTGMDIEPGPNVDIVGYENLAGPYQVVICGQTLEHVARPWEFLLNLRKYFTSFICVIAPFRAKEHKHPIDTFRYYPDGMRSLFRWAGIAELEIVKDVADTMGIGTHAGI